MSKEVKIKVDCTNIDELTEKTTRLIDLLKEAKSIIESFNRKAD